MNTNSPPPRLVPDRPSDAALAAAFWEEHDDPALHGEAGAEIDFIFNRAREIDAAAPPAEAPADKYSDFTRAELIDLLDKAYDQINEAEAPAERDSALIVARLTDILARSEKSEGRIGLSDNDEHALNLAVEYFRAPRVTGGRECPHRFRCDCLGACKYGLPGNGAEALQAATGGEVDHA